MILSIFLLVGLILLSGFFSASEVAMFSLSSMQIKAFKSDESPNKKLVAKLLSSPRDLLITIIMLNVMINILIQNVTSSLFGNFSGWAYSVGVPLALTVVFGEVLPKSIGFLNYLRISYWAAPILYRLQKIFLPLRKVLNGITTKLSYMMFFFLKKEEEISIDELQHALKASKAYGILNEDEAELVRGYLNLQESQVKELMRPREEVIFFDLDEKISFLVHLFVDEQCSRIPVCRQSLDDVVGIISSQTFFLNRDKIQSVKDLIQFVKKPLFAPESTSANALLRQMYDKQESIAMVVDEYGSISGLIALEDLVEKVVGEIADARDTKNKYTLSTEDVMIASGKMELAEFEEIFSVALPNPNQMVTLGGWLSGQMGDIPKTGAKYTASGFLFHVLAADPKRVKRIYVRRMGSNVSRRG